MTKNIGLYMKVENKEKHRLESNRSISYTGGKMSYHIKSTKNKPIARILGF